MVPWNKILEDTATFSEGLGPSAPSGLLSQISLPGCGVHALPWNFNASTDLITSPFSSPSYCSSPIGLNESQSSPLRDSDQSPYHELAEPSGITTAPYRDSSFLLSVVLYKVVTGFSHGNPRCWECDERANHYDGEAGE